MAINFIVQALGVNVINLFCLVNTPLAFPLLTLTNIKCGQKHLKLAKN